MSLNPSETQIQIALLEWASYHPILKDFLFHIGNQRKCSPVYGALLKRLGIKRGCSDLMLAYPVSPYHGLFLELKSNGKKPSSDQLKWLERMKSVGYAAEWCDNLNDAIQIIEHYMMPKDVYRCLTD
jgi:hypothetical protein